MRRMYKAVKFSFYTFAVTLVFLFIIPTTKQGMVLVASGAVIEAAKTETAQRISGSWQRLLDVDEWPYPAVWFR